MNSKSTIISTLVCLLPITLSVTLFNKLPDQIAVHFNNAGVADSYLPKAVAAFGLPLFLAAINLYSHFRINKDPKNGNVADSLKRLSKWLIPVISVVFVPITLFMSMGTRFSITLIAQALVGVVVVICGNYLPKCKRNYTIGIKLPWTLDNDDNWNKTHYYAGFVWVIGGIFVLLNAFFQTSWLVMIGIIILLMVLPYAYSYLFYKKQQKEVK